MDQAEREQAIQAVYALGSLAQVLPIPRLSRTLKAESAEAAQAGQRTPDQFMLLLDVVDAAMWLREATTRLNEEQQKRLEADTPTGPAAPEQPIPDDWAVPAPAAG